MRIRRILLAVAGSLAFLLLALAVYAFWPQKVSLEYLAAVAEDYDVTIMRDTWGVPHIFGVTDADAAFGLAYAHAEDDFLTIQETALAARGLLASVYGKDAAPFDYLVHLLRLWDTVDENYYSLSPEFRAVCEAYADGLNYYAALHPGEVLLPGLFPVTGEDVVAGSVHKSPLFFGLERTLFELFEEERKRPVSTVLDDTGSFMIPEPRVATGSNTFAVSPVRSAGGETFLAVNSHQPWEGPVTWYEAHIRSEEGWDAVGALFPGSPAIVHGHNRNLGWAFTVNRPDLVDVYVLEIDPEDPYRYLYDGEWLELESRQAPIRVKLLGRLSITVKEEVLWSVYGPVIRQDHGTYAIRYSGMGEVGIFEQLYRMNKAGNFDEWQQAMREGSLPMFHVGYADREGNIYYLYNGLIPLRSERYDWSVYLPGNTSETLWTEYLPFDMLPQVLNPTSGFIQDTNTTPYTTTIGPENPRPEDFSPTLGIETGMNNRGLRLLKLLEADEAITEEAFYQYKYDMYYDPESDVGLRIGMLLDGPEPGDPELKRALEILGKWDLQTNPENTGAALAILALLPLAGIENDELTIDVLMESLQEAVELLLEHHGRLDVPWEQVNRLRRGEVDLGLGGGPDILHAVHGVLEPDGRYRGVAGDSYVMLVTWDADGRVRSRSIHQYGSATLDESSPHYADQAPLFVRRELKPVWMDKDDILANLSRAYRPGE